MNTPSYPRVDSDEYREMRARSTDPETSHEAARKVDAEGQRGRIMELMRESLRDNNWTADELDEHIGWRVTTAGRRLSELHKADPPLVEKCGERKTRSNRLATVYRAVT